MCGAVPHKNAHIIKAWADGKVIHFREWETNCWGPWRVLKQGITPTRPDMGIEYRIADDPPPHKWQREKEAFLAGKKVEFTDTNPESGEAKWHELDTWLEAWCRSDKGGAKPIWDNELLTFRIKVDHQVRYMTVGPSTAAAFRMHLNRDDQVGRHRMNLKLVFQDGKLTHSEVI